MGWDIQTIGKHNLDTSTVESVAKQLSKAWKINIEYGYSRKYIFNPKTLKISDGDMAFISLGKIKCKKSDAFYILYDTNFSIRDTLSQLNNDLSKVKWVRNTKVYFLEEMTSWCLYELDLIGVHDYANKHPDNNFIAHSFIFKEAILISLYHDPFRWYGFMKNFDEDRFYRDYESLNEYRWYLQHFFSAVGVSKIFYFPDQGPAQLILDVLHKSWAEIEEYIAKGRYFDYLSKEEAINNLNLRRIIDIPTFIKARKREYSDYFSNIYTDNFSDVNDNYKPKPQVVCPAPVYPYKFRNIGEELNWLYYGVAPSEDGDEWSFLNDK